MSSKLEECSDMVENVALILNCSPSSLCDRLARSFHGEKANQFHKMRAAFKKGTTAHTDVIAADWSGAECKEGELSFRGFSEVDAARALNVLANASNMPPRDLARICAGEDRTAKAWFENVVKTREEPNRESVVSEVRARDLVMGARRSGWTDWKPLPSRPLTYERRLIGYAESESAACELGMSRFADMIETNDFVYTTHNQEMAHLPDKNQLQLHILNTYSNAEIESTLDVLHTMHVEGLKQEAGGNFRSSIAQTRFVGERALGDVVPQAPLALLKDVLKLAQMGNQRTHPHQYAVEAIADMTNEIEEHGMERPHQEMDVVDMIR